MLFYEITDTNRDEISLYSQTSERILLHYNEPDTGLFVAESPNVIDRALNAGYEPLSFLIEKGQFKGDTRRILENYPDIPVFMAEMEILKNITGFALTRGVLSLMRRKRLPSVKELCKDLKRIVVLESVMNPTNIGAIFRSAAALGMEAVLLTKGCSDPLYRRSARVSMGTVFQIPWTWLGDDWLLELHDMGFATAAMALRDDSVSIDDPGLLKEEKLAVILGTEGEGLKDETISSSKYTIRIPMSHGVDSLNVAAASAVAFWQLSKR